MFHWKRIRRQTDLVEVVRLAIEALRENADGLQQQGFEAWAETNHAIANELCIRAGLNPKQ